MKKLTKFGVAVAATFMIGTSFPVNTYVGPSLVSAAEVTAPTIDAAAAFVIEPTTGKVLLNQNGDTRLGIASMTKMITEYILFEAIENGEITWDQEVPVSEYVYTISQNRALSNVPLRSDGTYTIQELYEAMAIYSANAATIAIAEAISGSEPAFVDRMKEKLDSWGITDYELYSTTGLNNSDLSGNIYPGSLPDSENAMTARDVATVAWHLLSDYPEVLETTSIPEKTFREGTSDAIVMKNWNWMLPGLIFERENVDGLKTGTTDFAGASITGTAVENGMRIITVVMNATNGQTEKQKRFSETDKLMNWSFANWELRTVLEDGTVVEEVDPATIESGKEKTVNLAAASAVSVVVPAGTAEEDISFAYQPQEELLNEEGNLVAPVEKGQEVGTLEVTVEGDSLGYVNEDADELVKVEAAETVEKANFLVLTGRWVKEFFSGLFGSVI